MAMVVACATESTEANADDDGVSADEINKFSGKVDTSLPDVDAMGYAVDLKVDESKGPGKEGYTADVTGTYVATRDLTELTLDLTAANKVSSASVNGARATYRQEGDKIVIAANVAKGKTFTTRVQYTGSVAQADGSNPNDFNAFGGLMVRQKNADGKRIYTSLDWPSKARRWLPLRDHPSDGAMITIKATFPKSFTVVANGKKVATTDNADGTRTWRYEALTPMPTYDFHVAAYEDWKIDEAKSTSGIPVTTYTYSKDHAKQQKIFGDLHEAMDFYEKTYGKYRWGTASFLEEPIFGGGMEHASVVSMDETLFPDPAGAREVAFHELGHHWSGNLVRIRTWNDFWLSEGFTEYLTARALGAADGVEAEKAHRRDYLRQALAADRSSPHALRPADPEKDVLEIFDAISYQKGALVLHLLERAAGGPEKMSAFLKGWFEKHAFEAVSTRDLEKELSQATGKDLGPIFAGFVYAPGHPEVKVTFAAAGANDVDVTVEQLQNGTSYVFPLDLDFVDAAGAKERIAIDVDGKKVTKRVRVSRSPKTMIADPEEYLVGTFACDAQNACKTGYRCSAARCVP